MNATRTPLWQQLLGLWFFAILLSFLLVWLDSQRSEPFFWLLPYPNWRRIPGRVIGEFVARPVLATGVVGIPLVALVVSTGLVVARLATWLGGGGAATGIR